MCVIEHHWLSGAWRENVNTLEWKCWIRNYYWKEFMIFGILIVNLLFVSQQRTYSLVVDAWDWDNGTRNISKLFFCPRHSWTKVFFLWWPASQMCSNLKSIWSLEGLCRQAVSRCSAWHLAYSSWEKFPGWFTFKWVKHDATNQRPLWMKRRQPRTLHNRNAHNMLFTEEEIIR